jgi:tape measure domain-containing protein
MATIANIAVALTATTTGIQKGLSRAGRMFGRFRGAVSNALGSLAPLAGIVASALSVRSIIQSVDAWTQLNNQIKTITGEGEEHERVLKNILKAARRARTGVAGFTDVFARIGNVNENIGFTNDELIRLTETALKLGAVGGKSQEEIQRALVQMSQSFATGIVRAEEFNSIQEATPIIIREVAREMGLTMGQLRQLMLGGGLAASTFGRALLAAGDDADRLHSALDQTIGESLTNIKTSWLELVGTISESSGEEGIFAGFLKDADQTLKFLTETFKNPKQALEDLKFFMQTFLDDMFPAWIFKLGEIAELFFRLSPAGGVSAALDKAAGEIGATQQRAAFIGPANPLRNLDLEEANSKQILEELIKFNSAFHLEGGVFVR